MAKETGSQRRFGFRLWPTTTKHRSEKKAPLPKLYGFWLSPFMSLVAHMLTEAGIAYEYVRVSTLSGGNHTEDYQALNPIMKVPTFVDTDGTVVTESAAICRYIAKRYTQARAIYPSDDPVVCARIDAKSDFLTFHVWGPYFNWFVVSGHFPIAWDLRTEEESRIFALWSIFLVKGEMQRFLSASNFSPFLFGANPTLPDLQLLHLLEHGRILSQLYNQPELDFMDGDDTLTAFYEAMAARPSTAQILAAREKEFDVNSHELLNEMKPAHKDMLTNAKAILSEMFGHPV